jgi:hypothetical protein
MDPTQRLFRAPSRGGRLIPRLFWRAPCFLILLLLPDGSLTAHPPALLQAGSFGPNPSWIDVGLGYAVTKEYFGAGLIGNISLYRPAGLLTLRAILSDNIIQEAPRPPGEGRWRPDAVRTLEGYYGWTWKRKYGYVTANLGVGLVASLYTEGHTTRNWRYRWGLPVLLQAGFTPLSFVGLGVGGSYTVLPGPDMVTVLVYLELGILR